MGGGGSKSKSSTKGGNKRVTKHDQAVLDLKVQRDKLKQYQKRCEAVMTRETEIAKTLLAQGKKAQALIALKKKKLQEVHLARSQAQLDNVSTLIDSVEFAQIEVKVFDALKAGNVALGQLHDAIGGVDAVEELLLDTEDAIARQNEIDEALGQSLAAETDRRRRHSGRARRARGRPGGAAGRAHARTAHRQGSGQAQTAAREGEASERSGARVAVM
jgi:charged multivesicular body protein 6